MQWASFEPPHRPCTECGLRFTRIIPSCVQTGASMTAAWQRTRPCRGAMQAHAHLLAPRRLQNYSLSALSGKRSSWAPRSSGCFMRRSPGRRRLRPCANAGATEIAAFALGYGCMVGSCFRSLPQVRSADGMPHPAWLQHCANGPSCQNRIFDAELQLTTKLLCYIAVCSTFTQCTNPCNFTACTSCPQRHCGQHSSLCAARTITQILKIVRSGSAVGLSLTSHVVELLTDVVKLAYNTSKVR